MSAIKGESCLGAQEKMLEQMQVFNVGEDCPVFSQMFQFCQVRPLDHHDKYDHVTLLVTPQARGGQPACWLLMRQHETGAGCPQSYSGGSIGGAVKLNHGQADVVINWSGGLHHAKKAEVKFPAPSNQGALHAALRSAVLLLFPDHTSEHQDLVASAAGVRILLRE